MVLMERKSIQKLILGVLFLGTLILSSCSAGKRGCDCPTFGMNQSVEAPLKS